MNVVKLYKDHGVAFAEEGHKHCRDGWVNTPCPFCSGNDGLHLGYNTIDDFYRCWRCGWHPNEKVIARLLNCTEWKAKTLITAYGGKVTRIQVHKDRSIIGTKPFLLPDHGKLLPVQVSYLKKRNFDPEQLINDWGISGTSKNSFIDDIDYRYRLLIPIEFKGQIVSFQTRAVHEGVKEAGGLPYIACPMAREKHHHQHLLYGLDKVPNYKKVLVVEGVADVWRMGYGTVATFGIEYTVNQVRMLSKFEEVIVLFDNDPQAQLKATDLVGSLRLRTKARSITQSYAQDPGALSTADATELKKEIFS